VSIDAQTGRDLQTKLSGEDYPFDFEYTSLTDGEVIDSVTSILQTKRGTVDGSVDVTLGVTSHDSNNLAQVWISDGTDGEHYCLTMTVETSIGAKRKCVGVLLVKDVC